MSVQSQHLSRSTWNGIKFHVVFTPKYRKKLLFGHLRGELREVLRRLSRQKECEIIEGHPMPDHVHMLLNVPPKHAVTQTVRRYIRNQETQDRRLDDLFNKSSVPQTAASGSSQASQNTTQGGVLACP